MATARVDVQLTITNRKALKALTLAARVLGDVGDDMPWRDDVKKAKRALRYAAKHLQIKQVKGKR